MAEFCVTLIYGDLVTVILAVGIAYGVIYNQQLVPCLNIEETIPSVCALYYPNGTVVYNQEHVDYLITLTDNLKLSLIVMGSILGFFTVIPCCLITCMSLDDWKNRHIIFR